MLNNIAHNLQLCQYPEQIAHRDSRPLGNLIRAQRRMQYRLMDQALLRCGVCREQTDRARSVRRVRELMRLCCGIPVQSMIFSAAAVLPRRVLLR